MKIAFLFPGYGAQFVGMGKELYDQHRIIQELFEEASNCLDINFVKLCFASSEVDLGKINHAYTATFLVSSAITALLKQEGIKPDVLAGYNQGEYAALFAGDGMNLPDGLYLLNKYATFYTEMLDTMQVSAIRVSGVSTKDLENICYKSGVYEGNAFISIYETDTIHVVTGDTNSVEQVRTLASALSEKQSVDIEPVSIEVGLHSPLMNPVVDQLKMYLEKVDFKDLAVPMIESINGKQIYSGERIRDHVLSHINSAVMWTQVMKAIEQYDLIIEIGPGTMLSKIAKEYYPDKQVQAVNKQADIDALKKILNISPPEEKKSEPEADVKKDSDIENK